MGNSFATVSASETTSQYNVYEPTEGMFFALLQGLSLEPSWGVTTSQFSNATGQVGTVGSILETVITLTPGETFSFDWAFLAGDKSPWNDFALFYVKDPESGAIVFTEVLAQIRAARIPITAILLLLDVGS